MICCLEIAFSRTESTNKRISSTPLSSLSHSHTHIKIHSITEHSTVQHSTFDIKYCTNYMKPQLVCMNMCVNNDISGIAQKSEQCEQQKNRFIFLRIPAQHSTHVGSASVRFQLKAEWYLETGRNEARNYVYVISNRRLKTNWGQHWDAVWRWLNRFLTVFEPKMECMNFCGRHSHTQRERERESVYVKLLLYVRTWAWNFYTANTNEQTNRRTNQFSIMFLFVVVIFSACSFPIQWFGVVLLGPRWRKLTCTHTEYTACACVCDRTSTSAQWKKALYG